jgi:hypothetical protein
MKFTAYENLAHSQVPIEEDTSWKPEAETVGVWSSEKLTWATVQSVDALMTWPSINVSDITDLTHEKAKSAREKFLFINFPHEETQASLIHTSTLGDGREMYTMRFGIQDFSTPRPMYNGLAVFCRNTDGTIAIQKPISKDAYLDWSEAMPEKEIKKELWARYHSQLRRVSLKIGNMNDKWLFEMIEDIGIPSEGAGRIYDISDPYEKGKRQFLLFASFKWQNVECQFTTYKKGGNDIIEVHSFAREGDAGLTPMFIWIHDHAIPQIQAQLKEEETLQDPENILIRMTRDVRHDKVERNPDGTIKERVEHENMTPFLKWSKMIERSKKTQAL